MELLGPKFVRDVQCLISACVVFTWLKTEHQAVNIKQNRVQWGGGVFTLLY